MLQRIADSRIAFSDAGVPISTTLGTTSKPGRHLNLQRQEGSSQGQSVSTSCLAAPLRFCLHIDFKSTMAVEAGCLYFGLASACSSCHREARSLCPDQGGFRSPSLALPRLTRWDQASS